MRASMHLGRLHDATQYRLKRLHDLYNFTSPLPNQQQSLRLAHIAIELDNLNICALREFTISTLRKAKTTGGQRISVNANLGREDEIGAYILSIINNVKYIKLRRPARICRTDEPTIRDPKQTEKILISCNASNLPSLQNALSINSSLFRDIKCLRHFYAHRCKDTFQKVLANASNFGIVNPRHPDEILKFVRNGRPTSVLEEWLIEAKLFYEVLMQ